MKIPIIITGQITFEGVILLSFVINNEYRIYGIAAKLQDRKRKNQNQKPKRPFEEILKDQEDKPESSTDSAVRLDIKG